MNNYPEKLIVLDIDGCVTSIEDETYFNPDPAKYHPSKKIITKLKNFCNKNNVKILISSNWRKFDINGIWKNKYGTYKNPLPELKSMLGNLYFDTLSSTRHINKSIALIQWLVDNEKFNGSFVIFDDDINEQFQNTIDFKINDKFILIDNNTGITDDNLKTALSILNNK